MHFSTTATGLSAIKCLYISTRRLSLLTYYQMEITALSSLRSVVNMTCSGDDAILTKLLCLLKVCLEMFVLTLLHYSLPTNGDLYLVDG